MKVMIRTLTSSGTAYCLRRLLGDAYAWRSRLADWRRGRATEYGGPVLLPVTPGHYNSLYEFSEIVQFIRDYRAYDRNAQVNVAPKVIHAEFDTDTGTLRRLAHPPAKLAPSHAS